MPLRERSAAIAQLDLLVVLGRRIERVPALLLVTYRDDEVGPEHPLRSALAALPEPVVRQIAVAPLSAGCVAEQAVHAGRDPQELYELTGGNPLLVSELLSLADRAVPATVRDLNLARLNRLSRPARDVARLVSVIPTSADVTLLPGLAAPVQCGDSGRAHRAPTRGARTARRRADQRRHRRPVDPFAEDRGHHISAVLSRLNVTSRGQAIALAHRRRLFS